MSSGAREPLRRLVEQAAAPAWLHDAAGTLLHAGPVWHAGAPPGAATLPQAWLALLPAYDLVRHLETFAAALRAGERYAFAHRLTGRPDDEWYLTQAVPVRADEPVWLGATVPLPWPSRPGDGPGDPAAPAGSPLPAGVAGLRLELLADPAPPGSGVWCDAFALPGGKLGLAAGRAGARVAALARGALRGAALTGAATELVLAAAGTALTQAEPDAAGAVLVALYDPRSGWVDHAPARAGAEVRTAALRPGAALALHAGGPLGAGAVILLLERDLDAAGQA